jgi:hypothetical protein
MCGGSTKELGPWAVLRADTVRDCESRELSENIICLLMHYSSES